MGNIDTNKLLHFVLHWTFAGFWGGLGWMLFARLLLPHIPGL